MTPKRHPPRSSPGRTVRPRRTWRAPWIALAVVVAVAATVFALVKWRGGGAARLAPGLTPQEIVVRAGEAEARGDYATAFALYREGIARHPDDVSLLGSYGAATTNRSYAVRMNRGRLVPVMPTSDDRVRAAREALALFDQAQQAAPTMAAPALQKGLLYAAWGLPEDALVELYRAAVLGGPSPEIDRVGGAITLLQLGQGDRLGSAVLDSVQNGRPASR